MGHLPQLLQEESFHPVGLRFLTQVSALPIWVSEFLETSVGRKKEGQMQEMILRSYLLHQANSNRTFEKHRWLSLCTFRICGFYFSHAVGT